MSFLHFLEGLRTPFFDAVFSTITRLGEETFFILFGLIFFWCVNKKEGYYLLSIGFIGTIINQSLKLIFRIERPWVLDKNFTIVESARGGATGYSFPSGHTQSSIGVYGGLSRWHREKIIRIIGIILCVAVPFSRLYLGVHTPLDVGVSVIVGLILVFVLYPVITKFFDNKTVMRILFSSMTILAFLYWAFVTFYSFPLDTDPENLSHGIENAYKMLGCTVGIFISFEIDNRFINFDTQGNFLCQLFKFGLGIIPLLLIKEGLKAPLETLFDGSFAAHGIRYLLIVIFAGCVWPLTFKKFRKITEKRIMR